MASHEQENQHEDDASPSPPWSSLPDDIGREILACLPAKSVGRFRCVSRSWHATLSSAAFIKLHLRRANYQSAAGRPKLFFSPTNEPSEDYYFYAWQPGGAVTKLMDNDFLLPAPLTRPLHGLILLRCVRSGGYYVCNPSTGAVLPLPDTRVPWKTILRHRLPYYMDVVYGLGYCSATHRYKAVRIFSHENSMDAPCCDVFLLGGDTPAYWRPATSEVPMCAVKEANPAVFFNGHLHFLCRYDGGILTFNVTDETFGSMPVPRCTLGRDPLSLRMTELDGCLCVFDGCSGEGEDQCHVWLLRDYEAQQWEELCCIDRTAWPEPERTQLQSSWIAPLCLSNGANGSEKKIMFGTGTCKVFAVDHNGGGVPEILFRPDEAIAGSFNDTYNYPYNYPTIGLFEESLVPVGRDIEELVFSSPVAEAWYDVLKWLPAWSVARLGLVCREWRAMITTDCFIRSHAAIHATRPRIKFAIDPLVGSFSDLDDHINNRLFYGNGIPYDHPVQFSQPCHGLNLGRWSFGDYLYNPTLGINDKIEDVERDVDFFGTSIALGFDSEVDDHVMVSLAYEEKNMETREYKLRCDVRSLQRDDDWCSYDPPPRPVAVDVPPAYVNGKIYWAVEPMLGPESAVCELLVFDVIDREFEVMHGPSLSSHAGARMSILELYGAICMAWWDEDKNAIDVWRMKDMDGAWYMECRIELDKFSPQYSSREATLMSVDPIDGRILLNTGRSLGYYDPKTGVLETIYTVGEREPQDYRGFSAVIVQDSLVCPLMKW